MRIDLSFLPVLAATYLLIFARIGTMLMMLPGLGALAVSTRIRLTANTAVSATAITAMRMVMGRRSAARISHMTPTP